LTSGATCRRSSSATTFAAARTATAGRTRANLRTAKLLVAEEFLEYHGEEARVDVPPSLLHDLDAALAEHAPSVEGATTLAGKKRKRSSWLVISPGAKPKKMPKPKKQARYYRPSHRRKVCWTCGGVRGWGVGGGGWGKGPGQAVIGQLSPLLAPLSR
jgi:hypothetical protein